jgi:GT2 family glycosyltransferase
VADYSVLICTRNRADMLERTLDALDHQTRNGIPVTVVDQSTEPNPALAARAERDPNLTVINDAGQGLSRSRNIGWRSIGTEWLAILDDDCIPEPDWAEQIDHAIAAHPEASYISGYVGTSELPSDDYLPATPSLIEEEATVQGRWTLPWKIGLGVCLIVRNKTIEEIGGWDERLGTGTASGFPASDDMDFNYRFLRSGGVAYVTPAIRATHHQWRTAEDLVPLYEGYMVGWAGFAIKQLKSGDVPGGLMLWAWSLVDLARNMASAARRRSGLRFRITMRKLRGLVVGTTRALRTKW